MSKKNVASFCFINDLQSNESSSMLFWKKEEKKKVIKILKSKTIAG